MRDINGGVIWCNKDTYKRELQRFKKKKRPADHVPPPQLKTPPVAQRIQLKSFEFG